jgi:hypothetical protein
MINNVANRNDALAVDERISAASATAPRVSLKDLEDNVVSVHFLNAGEAVLSNDPHPFHALDLLTLCFVTTKNGFVLVGKSAPASAENFDEQKGKTFAYEDAMRQLWPLMGYALKERLMAEPSAESQAIAASRKLSSE